LLQGFKYLDYITTIRNAIKRIFDQKQKLRNNCTEYNTLSNKQIQSLKWKLKGELKGKAEQKPRGPQGL
jgi:hypothetical protein